MGQGLTRASTAQPALLWDCRANEYGSLQWNESPELAPLCPRIAVFTTWSITLAPRDRRLQTMACLPGLRLMPARW